ncbi:MAG: hypothetical protein ACYDA0_12560 [Candidatus Dormibacteraceae bacterium]
MDESERAAIALTLRRARTLRRTSPLHQMESNKGRREGWERYDTRVLQLRTIELVLERMLLGTGAARDEVTSAIAEMAFGMAPEQGDAQAHAAARELMGWLLNEDQGSNPEFSEFHLVLTKQGWKEGDEGFRLMEERQRGDSLFVVATSTGINVLLGSLDIDIEDRQKANELLIKQAIDSGKYGNARKAAIDARYLSAQYEAELHDVIQVARLDLGKVDWSGTVSQKLRDARTHLAERIRVEGEISSHLRERQEEVGADQLEAIDELLSLLSDCIRAHTNLHSRLMESGEVFLAEQERQRFQPPGEVGKVNFGREIFDPFLELPAERAAAVAGDFFDMLAGPRPPRLLDLEHLFDDLFASKREVNDDPMLIEEKELVEPGADRRFSDEEIAHAKEVLDTVADPTAFSELLALARSRWPRPTAEAVCDLLRIAVLYAYARDREPPSWIPAELVADPGLQRLDDEMFGGDDLVVRRQPVSN